MSQPSHDARAVVRAADALTTQVRRIADALTTPVVEQVEASDDDPTTGVRIPIPGIQECGPACFCRRNDTEQQAPTADEDQLRATRRESARVILDRAARGIALRSDESALLRQHFEAETREHDTARSVAWSNLRHVKTIVPELENADRIRAEAQRDRDQHAAVLREILSRFTPALVNGKYAFYQAEQPVPVEELERWRSVLAPTVERPWWETVAEVRGELAEAQAAIERVREVADRWDLDAPPPGNRPLTELRAALDVTEQPTTTEAP
jgi:hypothetical protein